MKIVRRCTLKRVVWDFEDGSIRYVLYFQVTERIALKERTINKDFEALGKEYQTRLAQLEQLSKQFDELTRVCKPHNPYIVK